MNHEGILTFLSKLFLEQLNVISCYLHHIQLSLDRVAKDGQLRYRVGRKVSRQNDLVLHILALYSSSFRLPWQAFWWKIAETKWQVWLKFRSLWLAILLFSGRCGSNFQLTFQITTLVASDSLSSSPAIANISALDFAKGIILAVSSSNFTFRKISAIENTFSMPFIGFIFDISFSDILKAMFDKLVVKYQR